MVNLSTVLWILGCSGVIIGGLLGAGYRENQRRLNKQDKALEETQKLLTAILAEISAIKAGNVGYVTTAAYVLNSKEFETKYDAKLIEVKTEVLEEVEAVEERLSKRLDRLEEKSK